MPAAIHRATPADVERLAPLFDAYRRFYGQPVDVTLARAFLEERLARGESWVLFATDASDDATGDTTGDTTCDTLGLAQLYPMFSSVRCRRTLVLNDLYVVPSARGQGVAAALLVAARQLATGLGAASIVLQTAVDNRPAQHLYERFGFVRDERFLTYALDLG